MFPLLFALLLAPPASLNVVGGISAAPPNKHVGKLASWEKLIFACLHAADSFLLSADDDAYADVKKNPIATELGQKPLKSSVQYQGCRLIL